MNPDEVTRAKEIIATAEEAARQAAWREGAASTLADGAASGIPEASIGYLDAAGTFVSFLIGGMSTGALVLSGGVLLGTVVAIGAAIHYGYVGGSSVKEAKAVLEGAEDSTSEDYLRALRDAAPATAASDQYEAPGWAEEMLGSAQPALFDIPQPLMVQRIERPIMIQLPERLVLPEIYRPPPALELYQPLPQLQYQPLPQVEAPQPSPQTSKADLILGILGAAATAYSAKAASAQKPKGAAVLINPDFLAAQRAEVYLAAHASSDPRYLRYSPAHYPDGRFITANGPCLGIDIPDPVTGSIIASSTAACPAYNVAAGFKR
jgi:hypothetical protein